MRNFVFGIYSYCNSVNISYVVLNLEMLSFVFIIKDFDRCVCFNILFCNYILIKEQ